MNFNIKLKNSILLFIIKEYWSSLSLSLNRFRENSKFNDVQLKVNENIYNVHRVVLSAASNYFEAMFTNDLAEKDQNFIEIHNVSSCIFEQLIDYIYKGEVIVSRDNVQELLSAASMFQLNEVVEYCCKFLQKQLHPSNCVGIYRFAEFHSCTMLRLETKRYIERHFAEVIVEEEFFDLPKETLEKFLRSEGLSIDREFQVLEATFKWINKDLETRKKYFKELMDSVRIPVIPMKLLENFVQDLQDNQLKDQFNQLLDSHKKAIGLLESNKKQLFINCSNLVAQTNGYYDVRWQPRMCARKSVYVIGGINQSGHRWNDIRSIASAERLDVFRGQWKSLPSMQKSRSCHGIAVLNGLIYIAGGELDSILFDNVEIYDPHENEWRIGPSLKQSRSCLGMCTLDSYIYVLGGWIGNVVGNSIERYDPETNEWNFYDKLPDVKFAMGVVSYDGLIYIIGGFDDHNVAMKSFHSYNPVTRQFQKLSDMHHPRAFFGFTVLHDHIYVAGGTYDGSNALRSVERYNVSEVRIFLNHLF